MQLEENSISDVLTTGAYDNSRLIITHQMMIHAMSDHFSHPHALCRHPDPKQAPAKQTMTTGAVLINLERRSMYVADGPPCEFPFIEHSI